MSESFTNAFKTAFACFIGFLFIHILKLQSAQWLIITILVVMTAETHIGGVLQKSYGRFLGTILGALIAILTIIVLPKNNLVLQGIVILSGFIFSYWAARSPEMAQALVLGAATTSVILLAPQPDLQIALLRLTEILSGVLIALFVNIVVFPISATQKLKKLLAKNLEISVLYYKAILDEETEKCSDFEKTMMNNFLVCQKLCDQSKAESRRNQQYYFNILFHQKRLFRAVSLLEHFLIKKPEHKEKLIQEYGFISEILKKLALKIVENKKSDLNLNQIHHEEKIFFVHFINEEIQILIKIISQRSV